MLHNSNRSQTQEDYGQTEKENQTRAREQRIWSGYLKGQRVDEQAEEPVDGQRLDGQLQPIVSWVGDE